MIRINHQLLMLLLTRPFITLSIQSNVLWPIFSTSMFQVGFVLLCNHQISLFIIYYITLETNATNYSAGILSATLLRQQQNEEKIVAIDWSPPSANCIEFSTGLWIRVYESGTNPILESYLKILRKCLKFKHYPFERAALSVLLPSSSNSSYQNSTDDECNFSIKPLMDCLSYQVEVVPDYQSLQGKSIRTEIVIYPSKVIKLATYYYLVTIIYFPPGG